MPFALKFLDVHLECFGELFFTQFFQSKKKINTDKQGMHFPID